MREWVGMIIECCPHAIHHFRDFWTMSRIAVSFQQHFQVFQTNGHPETLYNILPTATSCPLRTAMPSPHRAELIAASGVSEHRFRLSMAPTSESPSQRSSRITVCILSSPAEPLESTFPPAGNWARNLTEMRTRLSFRIAMQTKVIAEITATSSS